MNLNEYEIEMKKLEDGFCNKKKDLAVKYALANNPYKIGDIITDKCGSIKIKLIVTYLDYKNPSCVYHGARVKKNGQPYKNNEYMKVYQINIIKKGEK